MTSNPDAASGPARESLFIAKKDDDLSSHLHRQLIGGVGVILPFLLLIIAGWRPTEGLPRWEILDSISAYYYTGAVAALVGTLVALAAFLVTYRGYGNEYQERDRIAAIVASVAAIGVAFFPTTAPGDLPEPSWWTPQTRTIHYVSAVVLFSAFVFFCFFLFPKRKKEPQPFDKKVRNAFYYSCGVVMLACMIWAGSSYFTGAPIFWPEAIALWCFALSWLVKGHIDWTLGALGSRTRYYGRHPGQLVGDVWRAIVRG